MVDDELLFEAESIATSILEFADCNPDKPKSVRAIARACTGFDPQPASLVVHEGESMPVGETWRIFYSRRLLHDRVSWVIAHELVHWWFRTRGLKHPHEEQIADSAGAMIVCPRPAFRRAVHTIGCRVHALAEKFRTLQGLALLRVGEVIGRPVLLDRPRGRIARGEPFVWPSDLRTLPRDLAHPIRVDGRLGWMAAAA